MRDFVVYGVGELGKLLATAALRRGMRVTPITRAHEPARVLGQIAPDTPLLVSVGEHDLETALSALPASHRGSVILLQNELFPSSWERHGLAPSVLVPWVLQKRGLPTQEARPSPVCGPQRALLIELLDALSLSHQVLQDDAELAQALVDKYVFIVSINALGVAKDRTLGGWLDHGHAQVWDVFEDVSRLAERLVGRPIDRQQAHEAAAEGMRALAGVPARGRTAAERLERALQQATGLGLSLPQLERIAAAARA
ncbi:MAG TPA: hypothetical protein VFZ61_13835 [Polyangiales bacterium]